MYDAIFRDRSFEEGVLHVQSYPVTADTIRTRKSGLITECAYKRVNFKETVWRGTKKTVRNNECPY